MLTQDHVPFNARVSDVVDGCFVANDNDRHRVTGSVVNDCCHSREEAEEYVSMFSVESDVFIEYWANFIFEVPAVAKVT